MGAQTVGVEEVCRLLAGANHEPLTSMRVSQLVGEGMPKAARGQYEPVACMHWYLGRLRDSVKRKEKDRGDGSTSNLEDERRRLIAAQADNEEMTAEERRGQLVPLQVYESQVAAFVSITKMALHNLPARLAGRVEGLTRTESKALIAAAVRNCLGELAKNGRRADSVDGDAEPPTRPAAPKKRRRG